MTSLVISDHVLLDITNHSEAASLWLVRQDRATINSGSPPSCGATFWQRSVASLSDVGWLASKVSRYLSILCLWSVRPFLYGSQWCQTDRLADHATSDVQPPTYAENVSPLAFARRCCCPPAMQQLIDISCLLGPQQQTCSDSSLSNVACVYFAHRK